MSTIQDFENAPVGSTATAPDGNIALKTERRVFEWSLYDPRGNRCDVLRSDELAGYRLVPTAPTTASEALDLAWELGHPIKEGQFIPGGVRYVRRSKHGGLVALTAIGDWEPDPQIRDSVRTFDPLPDPEPDWLDAPAVIARVKGWVSCPDPQVFSRGNKTEPQGLHDGNWRSSQTGLHFHWRDLTDVTPLYPKEDNGGMYITGSGDIQFKDRNGQIVWEV